MVGHSTGMHRWTTAGLLGITLTALPLHARAGEPEGIRLTIEAPPGCLVEDELLAQVEALGARRRAARSDERARAFAVTLLPEGERYTARLVVHDLVGEKTERTVTSARCSDAAKSVALLVALALDDEAARAETEADATPSSLGPTFWPAPASGDTPTAGVKIERAHEGRQGSGGVVVTGIVGPDITGARAFAAARVSRSTRVGGSVSLASETDRRPDVGSTLYESNGWFARAGAIVGWGAPWNDTVVGFVGEAGVALSHQRGMASPELPKGAGSWSVSCNASACFDTARGAPFSAVFVSPFAATSLILQIPWKAPLRPVAGLTTAFTLGADRRVEPVMVTGELGLVLQAW